MVAVSRWVTAHTRTIPGVCLALLCSLMLAGCGGNAPQIQNAKDITPAGGLVKVDGEPAVGVEVILNEAGGMDMSNPTISRGRSGEDGRFQITTYTTDDGVPPGKYKVTFKYYGPTVIGAKLVDHFNGAYANPDASTYEVTVPADGENVDLGEFDLTGP